MYHGLSTEIDIQLRRTKVWLVVLSELFINTDQILQFVPWTGGSVITLKGTLVDLGRRV